MKPFLNKHISTLYILMFVIELLFILDFNYWRIYITSNLLERIIDKAAIFAFGFHLLVWVIVFFSLIGKIIDTKPAIRWSIAFLLVTVIEFGYLIYNFFQLVG